MQIALIILSAGLLGVIIYFAVSPKSSRLLKISALGALALIAISLGICGFFLVRGPVEKAVEIPFPVFDAPPEEPAQKGNISVLIVFLAIFFVIMGMITMIALRDYRNRNGTAKKDDGKPAAPVRNNVDVDLNRKIPDTKFNDDKFDDESFDIDVD